MKKYLFKLECLTNMHVGSGDVNYNIVDNEVEKDAVLTDVPIIHASGVKGALREHFKDHPECKRIFGDADGKGDYKFFDALLIARPLRVTSGSSAYVLTTSAEIIASFLRQIRGLGIKGYDGEAIPNELAEDKFVYYGSGSDKEIEGVKATVSETGNPILEKLIGSEYAIADSLREYDLPVAARNKLDDGISSNLWYEEFVPHKSIFYFPVLTPDNEEKMLLDFRDGEPIQFGGNASVGFGYTKITQVYGG